MTTANSHLSNDTVVCMDGQTAIKQFCKAEYMKGHSWPAIQKSLKKLIKTFVDRVEHKTLKEQVAKSLYGLAVRLWKTMQASASFGSLGALLALIALKNRSYKSEAEKNRYLAIVDGLPDTPRKPPDTPQPIKTDLPINPTGNAKKTWEEWFMRRKKVFGAEVQGKVARYWKDVEETMRRMAREMAIDEEDARDVKRRNSLRASAEIQVRQAGHEKELADLKANGHRLVICSTHADCSKRCEKWQGRVYSLDGMSGETDDKRKFVPLEVATKGPEAVYTTKAGRTYYNGLLGFNCRHRLVPYEKGKKPTQYSKEEVAKERAIDQKQRWYERQIIRAREEAIMAKDIDKKKYAYWKEQAKRLMAEYREYSHENGRKYYVSRVKIF